MPKSAGQKLKLLYLLRLLEEEGSEAHPVSTNRMIAYLELQGIHAERKSIYDDMEKLREFGVDVLQNSTRLGGGYYLGEDEKGIYLSPGPFSSDESLSEKLSLKYRKVKE